MISSEDESPDNNDHRQYLEIHNPRQTSALIALLDSKLLARQNSREESRRTQEADLKKESMTSMRRIRDRNQERLDLHVSKSAGESAGLMQRRRDSLIRLEAIKAEYQASLTLLSDLKPRLEERCKFVRGESERGMGEYVGKVRAQLFRVFEESVDLGCLLSYKYLFLLTGLD